MLDILQNIHEKGVVHRDLKPDNILCGLTTNINKVYIVDFGISKIYKKPNELHIPLL